MSIRIQPAVTVIEVDAERVQVVTAGQQGPAGPAGPQGAPGTVWISGNYAGNEPTQPASNYAVSSYALDTATGNVWQVWLMIHSGQNVWVQVGNLKGPVGPRPPRLTLITDWTLHFTTDTTPERVGIFKYVNKRNKAHRQQGRGYTPHKGKRWELVFELPTTATTWTYPTSYAGSVRPHDNDPFDPALPLNLRTCGKAKRWRVGAMHGGAWHLSPEVLMCSVNAFRFDQNSTKLGLVS